MSDYRPEDWKPGDVARVTLGGGHLHAGRTCLALRAEPTDSWDEGTWQTSLSGFVAHDKHGHIASAHRLVVLDPESDAQRLRAAWRAAQPSKDFWRDMLRALEVKPDLSEGIS